MRSTDSLTLPGLPLKIVLRGDQQADAMVVQEVAGHQQGEDALPAGRPEERGLVGQGLQLHAQHQAAAAHVLDNVRILRRQALEFSQERLAQFAGIRRNQAASCPVS